MLKKLLIVCSAIVFLAACGKKAQIEFEPPTTGPDPDNFQPAYGPNDPPVLSDETAE